MAATARIVVAVGLIALIAACSPHGQQTSASGLPLQLRLSGQAKPKELGAGWSVPEGPYIWTDGHQADVTFGPAPSSAVVFTLVGSGYDPSNAPQRVDVLANGTKVATWQVATMAATAYDATIPVEVVKRAPRLTVQLLLPDAKQPPGGSRLLGLAVREIDLSAEPPPVR